MNPTVLITGIAGFIGSNLAERLLNEGAHKIIGIDNLSSGVEEQIPDSVEFYKLDIRDDSIYDHFKNVDYVFHFAAKNCLADCLADPLETSDINVTGTVNVFKAALQNKVKKVIYAESSALYEGSGYFPTPESEVYPKSFYSVSKYSSMLFARAFEEFYGLKTTALRYFNVYGPRQDYRRSIPPVMSSFIIKLLRGENPTIYGDGEKRRDFIHVDDINDFHLLCMQDDRTIGNVYNLGTGKNHSINEIYQIISDLIDIHLEVHYLPELSGEASLTLADISEAKALGWYPRTDLTTGLQSSIEFIKKELEKGNI